jgi:putative phosphoesterase
MKIAIMSDTHIHKHAEKIIEIINKYFSDADLIIHAGDYTDTKVINILKKYKNFVGVWGNVDKESVRELLKEKEIINVMDYKIGIYHGHGDEKTTIDRAYEIFKDENVDIIIFGHSHKPAILTKNKILMLNPGSLTSKRAERWFSYIILNLEKEGIDVQIKLINK